MTDHKPLVHAQQVSKYYPDGQVHALVDVNLRVERGEYVAVMGPSGSGKSTLLNLLAGLDLPTSGTIAFDGASLAQMRDLDQFRAAQIGFVFQSFYLLPTLTAVENIQVPMFEGSRRPAERRAAALALLEQVGLSRRAGHLPSQLSVGERQRVAIAPRWPMARRSSWPTNRPVTSIRSPPAKSSTCSTPSTASAAQPSS